MRTMGMVLLVAAAFAFFYCSTQLSGLAPVPPGVELRDYLDYDAGKWELGRYAAAVMALAGALLSLFPKSH